MKGKREFNENMRQELISNAEKGIDQSNYFHGQIDQWVRKYEKYAVPGLSRAANDYFGGLNNALEKAKQDINKIFEAAEQVENDYAKKFGDIAFEMGLYANRINALLSVLQTPGPQTNAFAAPNFEERLKNAINTALEQEIQILIANPDRLEHLDLANRNVQAYIDYIKDKNGQDIKTISNVERLLLIMCYEYQNPEDKKKIDKFLEPLTKCGHDEDVLNIKYIIYAASEPYKTLLLANISKISIIDHHTNNSRLLKDQAFATPIVKAIVLSLDDHGLNDPRGPYCSFFHEIGHGIDDASKGWGYKTTAYVDTDFQKNMHDIIEGEANDHIKASIDTLAAASSYSYTEIEKAAVLNAILYGGTPPSEGTSKRDLYDDVVDQYRNDFNFIYGMQLEDYGPFTVVTDMFAAFTVHPKDSNNNSAPLFGGFAHDENYWRGISKFGIGLTGGEFVGMEFFAGYYSACVTGDTVQLDIIRNYFSDSCKAMDRMFDEIADSIK